MARVNAYLNEGIEAGASSNANTVINPTNVAVAVGPALQALQVVVTYQIVLPDPGTADECVRRRGLQGTVTLTARSTMRVEVPAP